MGVRSRLPGLFFPCSGRTPGLFWTSVAGRHDEIMTCSAFSVQWKAADVDVIEFFKEKVRQRQFSVVLPEGRDERVIQAAYRL